MKRGLEVLVVLVVAAAGAWFYRPTREPVSTAPAHLSSPTPIVHISLPTPPPDSPGSGLPAKKGDTVTAHYVGYLENGKKFDSSRERAMPITFLLGAGQVISGWDEGLVGMKQGGRKRLVIPPEKAYGKAARPPVIPPNSTLVFDVEMVKIEPGSPSPSATPPPGKL